MIYFVIWLQSALDELTEMWLAAESELRKAITQAAHKSIRLCASGRRNRANRGPMTCASSSLLPWE